MPRLQFQIVVLKEHAAAAGRWVSADSAAACRVFLFGLGFPTAHEVSVGTVGVVIGLAFSFGEDLHCCSRRGHGCFHVQAGRALAVCMGLCCACVQLMLSGLSIRLWTE